jgi:RNAse (barnase) inhibitor barstar
MEIENLDKRISYLTTLAPNRDLINQNRQAIEEYTNVKNYLEECTKKASLLEETLVRNFNLQVDKIISYTFTIEEIDSIRDIVPSPWTNSFTLFLGRSFYSNILREFFPSDDERIFPKKSDIQSREFIALMLANYYETEVRIGVDIEGRLVYRSNCSRESLLESIERMANKATEMMRLDFQLIERKKWDLVGRIFRNKEYHKNLDNLWEQMLRSQSDLTLLNILLKEKNFDSFFSEYETNITKYMEKIANYLEKHTGSSFGIQL